jgi:hypothetical protein
LFRDYFVGNVMDEVPVIGVSGASSRFDNREKFTRQITVGQKDTQNYGTYHKG